MFVNPPCTSSSEVCTSVFHSNSLFSVLIQYKRLSYNSVYLTNTPKSWISYIVLTLYSTLYFRSYSMYVYVRVEEITKMWWHCCYETLTSLFNFVRFHSTTLLGQTLRTPHPNTPPILLTVRWWVHILWYILTIKIFSIYKWYISMRDTAKPLSFCSV